VFSSKSRQKPKSPPEIQLPPALENKERDKVDFSPTAVSRAVLKQASLKPLVLYPLSLGLLGGLAAVLLTANPIFLGAAALGGSLGLGSWFFHSVLRRDQHAADYLHRMHQLLAQETRASVRQLEQDLQALDAPQSEKQLERLQEKFDAFQSLLGRKLDPNELTYSRYLGMTEEVFLAGLDNLSRIANILQGLRAIDEDHVRQRLLELDRMTSRNSAHEQEYASLNERLALQASQREKIDTLLAQNETAMTQMDRIMAAIAEMDTSLPRASMDMESAMEELARLAARADLYDRKY
jgi:hypothetical protein